MLKQTMMNKTFTLLNSKIYSKEWWLWTHLTELLLIRFSSIHGCKDQELPTTQSKQILITESKWWTRILMTKERPEERPAQTRQLEEETLENREIATTQQKPGKSLTSKNMTPIWWKRTSFSHLEAQCNTWLPYLTTFRWQSNKNSLCQAQSLNWSLIRSFIQSRMKVMMMAKRRRRKLHQMNPKPNWSNAL